MRKCVSEKCYRNFCAICSLEASLCEEITLLRSQLSDSLSKIESLRAHSVHETRTFATIKDAHESEIAASRESQAKLISENACLKKELSTARLNSADLQQQQAEKYDRALSEATLLLAKSIQDQADLSKRHSDELLSQENMHSSETALLKLRLLTSERNAADKVEETHRLKCQLEQARTGKGTNNLEISTLTISIENTRLVEIISLSDQAEIERRNFQVNQTSESLTDRIQNLKISCFQKSIEEKDAEIAALKTLIRSKDLEISSLQAEIDCLEKLNTFEAERWKNIFSEISEEIKEEISRKNCETLSERRILALQLQEAKLRNLEISSRLESTQDNRKEEDTGSRELVTLTLLNQANNQVNQLQQNLIDSESDFKLKLHAKEAGLVNLIDQIRKAEMLVEEEKRSVSREIQKQESLKRQHLAHEREWVRKFKVQQDEYQELLEKMEIVKMQNCDFQQSCLVRIKSLLKKSDLDDYEHAQSLRLKDLEISSLQDKANQSHEEMMEIERIAKSRVDVLEKERQNRLELKTELDLEISSLRIENKTLKDKGSATENSLRAENQELRSELKVSRDESTLLRKRLAGLQESETTVTELTRQLNELKGETARQKRETESIRAEMQLTERETAEMISAKEAAFKQLLDTAAASKEEISRLKKELRDALNSQSAELKQDSQISKIHLLKIEENSRSKFSKFESTIQSLETANKQLRDELHATTLNFHEKETEMLNIKHQLQLVTDEMCHVQGDMKAKDHFILTTALKTAATNKALQRSNTLLSQSSKTIPSLVVQGSLNFQINQPDDDAVISEALRLTFAENENLRGETIRLADEAAVAARNFQVQIEELEMEKVKVERRLIAEKKLTDELSAQLDSFR